MDSHRGLLKICDKKAFLRGMREEIVKAFTVAFFDRHEFLDVYDDTLLTDEVMGFWFDRYSMMKHSDTFFIMIKGRERLRMCLYKELCEKVLNKLVDMGKLEMLWDNRKKRVFWKKKEARVNTSII